MGIGRERRKRFEGNRRERVMGIMKEAENEIFSGERRDPHSFDQIKGTHFTVLERVDNNGQTQVRIAQNPCM